MAHNLQRFLRTAAAGLTLLCLLGVAHAESLTLAHSYAAQGTNPDGSAYQGTVSIEILSDTTFAIKWVIGCLVPG